MCTDSIRKVKAHLQFKFWKTIKLRNKLNQLVIHKPMGADRMHLRVLKELVDIIVKPLSIICESSWRLGKVTQD